MTPQGVAVAVANFVIMALFWGGLVYFIIGRINARKVSGDSKRHRQKD